MSDNIYEFIDINGHQVLISESELFSTIERYGIKKAITSLEGKVICQVTFHKKIPLDEMSAFIKGISRATYGAIQPGCHIDLEMFGYTPEENKKVDAILDETITAQREKINTVHSCDKCVEQEVDDFGDAFTLGVFPIEVGSISFGDFRIDSAPNADKLAFTHVETFGTHPSSNKKKLDVGNAHNKIRALEKHIEEVNKRISVLEELNQVTHSMPKTGEGKTIDNAEIANKLESPYMHCSLLKTLNEMQKCVCDFNTVAREIRSITKDAT